MRDIDAGVWNVQRRIDGELVDATGWITTGPKSGVAQLWFDELPDDALPGSQLEYVIEVTDPGRIDAFRMELTLDVNAARDRETTSGTSTSRNANSGKGRRGGSDSLLNLPKITPVHREHWPQHDFNEMSALRVVHVGTEEDESAPVYDFFVNVDNKYLLHSYKQRGADAALLEKQFIYGLVLVGLALIQDDHRRPPEAQADVPGIEEIIARTTRALGPILVPMLQSLGSLNVESAV